MKGNQENNQGSQQEVQHQNHHHLAPGMKGPFNWIAPFDMHFYWQFCFSDPTKSMWEPRFLTWNALVRSWNRAAAPCSPAAGASSRPHSAEWQPWGAARELPLCWGTLPRFHAAQSDVPEQPEQLLHTWEAKQGDTMLPADSLDKEKPPTRGWGVPLQHIWEYLFFL